MPKHRRKAIVTINAIAIIYISKIEQNSSISIIARYVIFSLFFFLLFFSFLFSHHGRPVIKARGCKSEKQYSFYFIVLLSPIFRHEGLFVTDRRAICGNGADPGSQLRGNQVNFW